MRQEKYGREGANPLPNAPPARLPSLIRFPADALILSTDLL